MKNSFVKYFPLNFLLFVVLFFSFLSLFQKNTYAQVCYTCGLNSDETSPWCDPVVGAPLGCSCYDQGWANRTMCVRNSSAGNCTMWDGSAGIYIRSQTYYCDFGDHSECDGCTCNVSNPTVSSTPACTNDTTPTWTWSAYDDNPDNCAGGYTTYVKLDGGSWTQVSNSPQSYTPSASLAYGQHELGVRFTDNQGDHEGYRTITVDCTTCNTPNTPTVSTALACTDNKRPTWTWNAYTYASCGNYSTQYSLDGAGFVALANPANTSWTPTTDLSYGNHNLRIKFVNTHGEGGTSNSSAVQVDCTVCNPPNNPNVTGPLTCTSDNTPTWTWQPYTYHNTCGASSYQVAIQKSWSNPTQWESISSGTVSYTPPVALPTGQHTLKVKYTNSWGSSQSEHIVDVDCTSCNPPNNPNVTGPLTCTSDNTPTWTWQPYTYHNTCGASSYQVAIQKSWSNPTQWESISSGTVSYTPPSALSSSNHTLKVRYTNSWGSQESQSTVNIDSVRPAVTNGAVIPVCSTSQAGLGWSWSLTNQGCFDVTRTELVRSWTGDTWPTWEAPQYSWTAPSNNRNQGDYVSVRFLEGPSYLAGPLQALPVINLDLNHPTVEGYGIVPPCSKDGTNITWLWGDPSTSTGCLNNTIYQVQLDKSWPSGINGTPDITLGPSLREWTSASPVEDGSFVNVRYVEGNSSVQGNGSWLSLPSASVDNYVTPPDISVNIVCVAPNTGYADIDWPQVVDPGCSFNYGQPTYGMVYSQGGNGSNFPGMPTTWSLDTTAQTGNIANGLYTTWIYSKDNLGNLGGASSNFTISCSCASLQAPTGLTVTAKTHKTATLSWNTIAGAENYKVEYRPVGGSWTTATSTLTTTTYQLTNLTVGGSYDWRISAQDTSFGCSSWSPTTSALFTTYGNLSCSVSGNSTVSVGSQPPYTVSLTGGQVPGFALTYNWTVSVGNLIPPLNQTTVSYNAALVVNGVEITATVSDPEVSTNCLKTFNVVPIATPVSSCLISPNSFAKTVGESQSLTSSFLPSNATPVTYNWSKTGVGAFSPNPGNSPNANYTSSTNGNVVINLSITDSTNNTVQCSPSSGTFSPPSCPALTPPTNLAVGNRTHTTTTVSWGAVVSADEYKLEWKRTVPTTSPWLNIITSNLSHTILDLAPGMTYEWKVSAHDNTSPCDTWSQPATGPNFTLYPGLTCANGSGISGATSVPVNGVVSYSALINGTVPTLPLSYDWASPPTPPSFSSPSAGSFNGGTNGSSVSYRAPTLPMSGVNISIYVSDGEMWKECSISVNITPISTPITACNIDPASFSFAIGESQLLTGQYQPSDATPTNFSWSISGVGGFNPASPNGSTATYTSGIAGNGTINLTITDSTGANTTCTPSQATVTTTCTPLNSPLNLIVETITHTKANVLWDAVLGAEEYKIEWKNNTSSVWENAAFVNVNNYQITNLVPNTTYNWRVSAHDTSGGCNTWSNTSNGENFTTYPPLSCSPIVGPENPVVGSTPMYSALVNGVVPTLPLSYDWESPPSPPLANSPSVSNYVSGANTDTVTYNATIVADGIELWVRAFDDELFIECSKIINVGTTSPEITSCSIDPANFTILLNTQQKLSNIYSPATATPTLYTWSIATGGVGTLTSVIRNAPIVYYSSAISGTAIINLSLVDSTGKTTICSPANATVSGTSVKGGTISGNVSLDYNKDGVADDPAQDVSISIESAFSRRDLIKTDTNGDYSKIVLEDTTYTVSISDLGTYVDYFISYPTGNFYSVDVSGGNTYANRNFLLSPVEQPSWFQAFGGNIGTNSPLNTDIYTNRFLYRTNSEEAADAGLLGDLEKLGLNESKYTIDPLNISEGLSVLNPKVEPLLGGYTFPGLLSYKDTLSLGNGGVSLTDIYYANPFNLEFRDFTIPLITNGATIISKINTGDSFNPKEVYAVKGSLEIDPNVKYDLESNGVAIVYVDNDLLIKNDFEIASGDPLSKTIIFIVTGNVVISPNAKRIDASIYAYGSVTFEGNTEPGGLGKDDRLILTGAVASKNNIFIQRDRSNIAPPNGNETPSIIFYYNPSVLIDIATNKVKVVKIVIKELN